MVVMEKLTKRVDPFDVVPKYHQLFELIRQKIEAGEWLPYQPIPSERDLVELYNVSRVTVRQALENLAIQGYVFREHGKGTFVSPPKLQQNIQVLNSFSEDMQGRGLAPGQKIIKFELIKPGPKIAERLEIQSENDQVIFIERLRLAGSEVVGLHRCFLNLPNRLQFTQSDLEATGSLYRLLEEKLNVFPLEADEELEATLADSQDAKLLGIPPGSPILSIERTVWSQYRRPFEFVQMIFRGDRYRYFWHTTRAMKRGF
jgi:GntR family transcriptional regulator